MIEVPAVNGFHASPLASLNHLNGLSFSSDRVRPPLYPSRIGGHKEAYLIIITGATRGDEGKGIEFVTRLNDLIAAGYTVALAYKANGGANSGHTVFINGEKYVLNLLPCGVLVPGVKKVGLGAQVHVNPEKLAFEIMALEARGIEVHSRLMIDPLAQLSTNLHRIVDKAVDLREQRGTTAAGITPTAIDFTRHHGIFWHSFLNGSNGPSKKFAEIIRAGCREFTRMAWEDLQLDPKEWDGILHFLTKRELRANEYLIRNGLLPRASVNFDRYKGNALFSLNADLLIEETWNHAKKFAYAVKEIGPYLHASIASHKHCAAEQGQGHFLDPLFGIETSKTATVPSWTSAIRAARAGVTDYHVVAVIKGYSTAVGTHTLLTLIEHEHPLYQKLSALEFGAVTARQRVVSWPSAVELAVGFQEAGFHSLSVRKLDPMSLKPSEIAEGHKLKICTGFRNQDGELVWDLPRDIHSFESLQPEYIELEPWSEDISAVRSFSDLPRNAQRFIAAYYYYFAQAVGRGDISQVDPGMLPPIQNIGVGGEPDARIKDVPSPQQLIWMWEAHLSGY